MRRAPSAVAGRVGLRGRPAAAQAPARRRRARRPARAATPAAARPGAAMPPLHGARRPARSSRRCGPTAPASGRRRVMDRIAKGFSDEEIQAIAAWHRGAAMSRAGRPRSRQRRPRGSRGRRGASALARPALAQARARGSWWSAAASAARPAPARSRRAGLDGDPGRAEPRPTPPARSATRSSPGCATWRRSVSATSALRRGRRRGRRTRPRRPSTPAARRVTLADGAALPYDRLVLAPGIDLRFDALPGYDEAAADAMPHAWKAGRADRAAAAAARGDGGRRHRRDVGAGRTPTAARPGPYERASLIAHYLKTRKPRSKLIVLDAKDAFSKQRLFQAAWAALYPDLLEWVPLSAGGRVTAVDAGGADARRPSSATTRAAVANVIPPQRAGRIAQAAGVADRTGWCPIDPVTFESRLQPGIHVIGDAAIAGAMPKSAFAANAAGQGLRRRRGGAAARRGAGRAEADQHLLQPGGAGLRHLGRRRVPAGRDGAARRHRGRRRHQPARRARLGPRARGRLCR